MHWTPTFRLAVIRALLAFALDRPWMPDERFIQYVQLAEYVTHWDEESLWRLEPKIAERIDLTEIKP